MANFFEEDLDMDDIGDDQTPLLSLEQHDEETSFTLSHQEQHQKVTQSKVRELSDYIGDSIHFNQLRHQFTMQGKILQFRKGGM